MRTSRFARFAAAGSAVALAVSLFASAGIANASTLFLSKTSDSLSINQYDQITATPSNGLQVIVSSNSSPNVASATTTGTVDQIQVQGLLAGSTNILICTTDQSECGTVFVTVAGGSSSTLNFTNSNPTVSQGQTTSIGTTNAQSSTLTLSSNSNPSAVNASVAGQNITITGVTFGSSSITVCASGTSQCGTLYVTVGSGSGSTGSLSFSNSSPSVSIGQSSIVSVYGGSGSYFVSNNTNSSIATVALNGSNITVYGLNTGTSNATVCDSAGSAGCSTLYVTVGSGSSSNAVTFSTTNPVISVGQSSSVSIYGSGNYYVSTNTNSSIANVSLSGSILSLYGNTNGSTNVTICEQNNSSACGTLYVNVGSGSSSSGVTFSNSNPNVPMAGSLSVTLYSSSGSQFYVSSNSNPSIVSTSLSGTTLTLYGLTSGSTTITVCTSGISQCGTLPVTVNGSSTSSAITFSTSSPTVTSGQTVSVAIYGGSSYYISTNTSPTIVSSTISGTNLNLYGIAGGNSSVTVCSLQNISQCSTVTATVNSGATSGGAVSFLTTSLPDAVLGAQYSQSIGVTGGTPPYTYTVYSGILPAGLTLGTTGQITGVPTVQSPSSFTVRANDELGNSAIENLTLNVDAAGSIPVPASGGGSNGGYHDGALVNDGGTIYIINNGTKTPFTSAGAFLGLGYTFGSVVNGSTSSIASSGSVVSNSSAAHPAGSWINSSGTVYFVTSSGIVPVPSAAVFTSNNGSWSLVVPANSADLLQTVLSVMQPTDSRVE